MLRPRLMRISAPASWSVSVLASGALMGSALFVPYFWAFSSVALVPLLFAVTQTERARDALLFGELWGIGHFGAALSFVFAMLPLDWLGISSTAVGFIAAMITWLFVSSLLASAVALFALVMWKVRTRSSALLALAIPALWVASEVFRTVLVSFVALGPSTIIGNDFTIGNLAYILAWAPGVLGVFAFGGPLLLSAVIVLANTLLYLAIRDRVPTHAMLVAVAIPCALFAINAILPPAVHVEIGATSAMVRDTRIALVHTDIDASLTVSRSAQAAATDEVSTSILDALMRHPDAAIIALPEDSRYIHVALQATSTATLAAIEALAAKQVVLLDSMRVDQGSEARDMLYAYDFARATTTHISAKAYLAPFGEYVPYIVRGAAHVLGFGEAIERLIASRSSYVPGIWHAEDRIVEVGGVRLGMISCSELFAPRFMRSLAHEDVDAIVMLSSQSWIQQDSKILFNQMFGMAIVQSAVVGRPYLQATNYAPTIMISR